MNTGEIIFLFVVIVVAAVLACIWERPVKRAKKRVEELELKWAESKTQMLAAGKDPEKDNPFEELLDQARRTYSYEKHSFDQAALWISLGLLPFWFVALLKIMRS